MCNGIELATYYFVIHHEPYFWRQKKKFHLLAICLLSISWKRWKQNIERCAFLQNSSNSFITTFVLLISYQVVLMIVENPVWIMTPSDLKWPRPGKREMCDSLGGPLLRTLVLGSLWKAAFNSKGKFFCQGLRLMIISDFQQRLWKIIFWLLQEKYTH